MLSEQREGVADVALSEFWAVAADDHDFLVAESRQGFHRVFQPLPKRRSLLKMNLEGRRTWAMAPARREEMQIETGVLFKREALRFQEDAECAGPATPLAVGVGGVSKDQECAAFHRHILVCPWDRWISEKDSGAIRSLNCIPRPLGHLRGARIPSSSSTPSPSEMRLTKLK